jgi:PAS domain-containing protein
MNFSIHTISPEDAIAFVCEATWGFAEVDPEGRFTWVNPAYCKILDAPPDLVI